ncbi:uncharacterized protein [Dermacentor andersoni]|uniref:uncharacterized protein isoform X2 n=1 Tax=Dermacentor andersoni TaxID=34620 RepID=UPI003B3B5380
MLSHKNVKLGAHVWPHQRELLVAFMEGHRYLVRTSCALTQECTVERRRQLWSELTALLNRGPGREDCRTVAGVLAEGGISLPPRCRRSFRKSKVSARSGSVACDIYNAVRNCSGTGGGRLPGLRGRVLALVGTSTVTGVCEPFFQPLDEPAMEVTVGTQSVGTTAGTSGLSRERALQQPEVVVPAEPLPRSPPATAQPAAGPGGVRTSYQPRMQRRFRGPRRVSRREALVQRLADDYARSVVQNDETNELLRGIRQGVDRLAAATERVVAAVERQADQVAGPAFTAPGPANARGSGCKGAVENWKFYYLLLLFFLLFNIIRSL